MIVTCCCTVTTNIFLNIFEGQNCPVVTPLISGLVLHNGCEDMQTPVPRDVAAENYNTSCSQADNAHDTSERHAIANYLHYRH